MADDWGADIPTSNSVSSDFGSVSSSQADYGQRRYGERDGRPARGRGRGTWHGSSSGNGPGDHSFNNQQDSSGGNKIVLKVQETDVGRIIGKGGSTIRELSTKSGARINVDRNSAQGGLTNVEITGTDEQRANAKELIENLTSSSGYRNNPPQKMMRIDDNKPKPLPVTSDYEYVDWDSAIQESTAATKAKWEALARITNQFYFEDPEVANKTPEEVATYRLESNNVMISYFNEKDTRPLPNPIYTFEQAFSHFPEIMVEIDKNKFTRPSPIQSQAWPVLLQGIDLIGIAQTGTGKTLAYLLPAMIHIDSQPTPRDQRVGPTALIMAPTRELAQQIEKETQKYKYRGIKSICIYGGGDRRQQVDKVGQGVEIVIATPGRLNDLCMNKIIDLSSVSYLVLDEADRMLDMGFEPQIKKILLDVRPDRQTVLTSATWPEGVRRLASQYMNDPFQVVVGTWDLAATHTVTQKIEMLDMENKRDFLDNFLQNLKDDEKVIVFVAKKIFADELASDYALKGVNVQCIHGDRDQHDREQALDDIKTGYVKILIATDVASRGLDIDDITHILNYDFPRNVEEYVHRIGRTGRAGRSGASITIMTREDWKHAHELIKLLEEAKQEVPEKLVKMAERYAAWKEKKDAEEASLGPRRGGRGGGGGYGGGGGFGGGGGGRRGGGGGGGFW